MASVLSSLSRFAKRLQVEHALAAGASVLALTAGVLGVRTLDGEIALGFATVHLLLSFVISTSRTPAWLRETAEDVEKALDGAVGYLPVLTALRAVLLVRGAPSWLIVVLSDLIRVAPLAGTTTGTLPLTGFTASVPTVLQIPALSPTELQTFSEAYRRASAPIYGGAPLDVFPGDEWFRDAMGIPGAGFGDVVFADTPTAVTSASGARYGERDLVESLRRLRQLPTNY